MKIDFLWLIITFAVGLLLGAFLLSHRVCTTAIL